MGAERGLGRVLRRRCPPVYAAVASAVALSLRRLIYVSLLCAGLGCSAGRTRVDSAADAADAAADDLGDQRRAGQDGLTDSAGRTPDPGSASDSDAASDSASDPDAAFDSAGLDGPVDASFDDRAPVEPEIVCPDDLSIDLPDFGSPPACPALEQLQVVFNGQGGFTSLGGAGEIALSDDGTMMFVVAFDDGALTALARDPATGALFEAWSLRAGELPGMDFEVEDAALTHTGRHVVLRWRWDSPGFAVLETAEQKDDFRLVQRSIDETIGSGGCHLATAIPPQGNHVYLLGGDCDGLPDPIWLFEQDPCTGQLALLEAPAEEGLKCFSAPVFAPAGKWGWCVGTEGVQLIQRTIATGHLEHAGTYTPSGAPEKLPQVLAASPGGERVFVAEDFFLYVWAAASLTGELELEDAVACPAPLEDCWTRGLVAAPGGKDAYVACAGPEYGQDGLRHYRRAEDGEWSCLPELYPTALTYMSGDPQIGTARLSPDGTQLYLVVDPGIALFARDPSNGELTLAEVFEDGEGPFTGMREPINAALSPDGRHLYVNSGDGGAVSAVAVDAESQTLTPLFTVPGGPAPEPHSWPRYHPIAVSPDGKNVYVTSWAETGEIVAYARDEMTGGLAPVQYLKGGANGLYEPYLLAVPTPGNWAYVVGCEMVTDDWGESWCEDRLGILGRDPETGQLALSDLVPTYSLCPTDCGYNLTSLAFPPDGLHAFAVFNNAVVALERDLGSGSLSPGPATPFPEGCHTDVQGSVLSPDGLHLYVRTHLPWEDVWGLAVYAWDAQTGQLAFVQEVEPYKPSGWTWAGPLPLAVTGDGMYVLSTCAGRIRRYVRDPVSGFVTWAGEINSGADRVFGLGEIMDLVAHPTAPELVLTVGSGQDSVALLRVPDCVPDAME